MRLLLDTHVLLWALTSSPRLKLETIKLIEAAGEVMVSAALILEIAIKVRLGKLAVDVAELAVAVAESGFVELPVTGAHAAGVARLPLLHHDPFDRLLLAQAVTEPLGLLTADAAPLPYSELVQLV